MEQLVYNTLANKKEVFKTLEPGKVKLYLCGPTVYDYLHIGNFRGPIVFNMIRNWLEFTGYDVTFAYNYTDVDDKIIKKAQAENVDSRVISERYIKAFEEDFNNLKLKPHEFNPKVTDHIDAIIELIEGILKNGKAYEIDGEVFFSINDFETYGGLSKKKLDDLEAGSRVEVDSRKRNPHDFVLWKPSKENEPAWDSPWGKGRPGWHIECSAMVKAIFGDSIDIHGGGIDLIFPHHENEIAQSEACNCTKYCNYWIHNEFISMGDEKMSKSLGNVITANNFMKTYDGEVLKFLYLNAHYRSRLSVTDEKIRQSVSALYRVYSAKNLAEQVIEKIEATAVESKNFSKELKAFEDKISESMHDDFNTAETISVVFEATRLFNSSLTKKRKSVEDKAIAQSYLKFLDSYGQILALFCEDSSSYLDSLDEMILSLNSISKSEVEKLLADRNEARNNKKWEQSDLIRDQLAQLGVEVLDGSAKGWRSKV